jgi:hypothetical protein
MPCFHDPFSGFTINEELGRNALPFPIEVGCDFAELTKEDDDVEQVFESQHRHLENCRRAYIPIEEVGECHILGETPEDPYRELFAESPASADEADAEEIDEVVAEKSPKVILTLNAPHAVKFRAPALGVPRGKRKKLGSKKAILRSYCN